MSETAAAVIKLHPKAAHAPDFRKTLAEAIARRDKAEKRADDAKARAKQAEQLQKDARAYLDGFNAAHDAKIRTIRDEHVKAVSAAIREGRAVPIAPTLPGIDKATLEAAESQHDALEVSAVHLAVEASDAAAEAAKRADEVREAAEFILDADATQATNELCAAYALVWELRAKLTGFFEHDGRRPTPRLQSLKERIADAFDIQKREAARDPTLIEGWRWQRHQMEIMFRSETAWQAYAGRLCTDPAATFDTDEESSQ